MKGRANFLVWTFVLTAIGLNIGLTFYSLQVHSIFPAFFHYLSSIRSGEYIFKKGFLAIAALSVWLIWLNPLDKKFLERLKPHLVPILLILFCLLAAHFLSFKMWFLNQDYRILGARMVTNLQNIEAAPYTMMLYYLVLRWFGTNFVLYNGFSLFIYFLGGIAIYFLINKLQTNKFTALIAALFFVTTPTLFHESTIMPEFMGDGFALILFIFSIYLMINRFYPGSVIFTAAALEFGVSRTNFITIPLLIVELLYTVENLKKINKNQILTFISLLFLPIIYRSIITPTDTRIILTNIVNTPIQHILRFFTAIFGVSVPHQFTRLLIIPIENILDKPYYTAPLLGALVILFILLLTVISLKKSISATKLLLLGFAILIGATIIPSIISTTRLTQNILQLTRQFFDSLPSNYTIYGVFPAFGLSLIISGIVILFKSRHINILFMIFIFTNIVCYIVVENTAVHTLAEIPKDLQFQFLKLIPADGKLKLIFVPNRTLYGNLDGAQNIFMPTEPIIKTDNTKAFLELIKMYSPPFNQIYYFILPRTSNNIYDFSYKLRAIPREKLSKNLDSLIEETERVCN